MELNFFNFIAFSFEKNTAYFVDFIFMGLGFYLFTQTKYRVVGGLLSFIYIGGSIQPIIENTVDYYGLCFAAVGILSFCLFGKYYSKYNRGRFIQGVQIFFSSLGVFFVLVFALGAIMLILNGKL